MYDIKTAADIQEALKDLPGGTIQDMLEAELNQQMEAREEPEPEYTDSRNGYKPKTLWSSMGEIPIQVPQDRNSDFEPQVEPKYEKNISEIEGKIIATYPLAEYQRCITLKYVADKDKKAFASDLTPDEQTALPARTRSGRPGSLSIPAA